MKCPDCSKIKCEDCGKEITRKSFCCICQYYQKISGISIDIECQCDCHNKAIC